MAALQVKKGPFAMRLLILTGSMTGTADSVAEELSDAAGDHFQVRIAPMDGLTPDIFQEDAIFIICTSTYGQGDVPDNAQAFFESLTSCQQQFDHVQYSVICLGDRTYAETYCHAGKKFDALLEQRGARRIGECLELDASSGQLAEDVALEWFETWKEQLTSFCNASKTTPLQRFA